MRHVPTSLYIDTEVFVRQQLKFDTNAFNLFRDTFVKGGIRLLVPKIMERELLRKFSERAFDTTKKLIDAHQEHPIDSLSLIDVPARDELESKVYQELCRQWETFKGHFIIEELPLVDKLEDVVDWYFRKEPPFSGKKSKEFPDAFVLSTLELYHNNHKANIAVISGDGDFREACAKRRFIQHFSDLKKYVEAFEPELKSEDLKPADIDPTIPIITEDLTELKSLLARGNTATPIEIERVLSLLENRGTNYEYFFQHAEDGIWLEHLISNGYFNNPPDLEVTSDGSRRVPFWPPIHYLIRVFETNQEIVLQQLERLASTSNTFILEGVLDVALKADSADTVARLFPMILSYIDSPVWMVRYDKVIKLLEMSFIFDKELAEFTPLLLSKLVSFIPDPNAGEQRDGRSENPNE